MAGAGFIASPYPSLEEHEAHTSEFRRQLAEIRRLNAQSERHQRILERSSDGHVKRAEAAAKSLVDLADRAKFVKVAADSSKPRSSGPQPHEFYQDQSAKVRDKGLALLSAEAEGLTSIGSGTSGGSGSASSSPSRSPGGPRQQMRKVPANFSPFQGMTSNMLQKQHHTVLCGLRSPTQWQGGKRPGRLPCLLPRESPHRQHGFQSHNASWMSKVGTLEDLGRSRAHISMLTSTRSCPDL